MFGRKNKSKMPPGSREILLKGKDAKRFRNIVDGKIRLIDALEKLNAEIDGFDKAGTIIAQAYLKGGEAWMTFNAETNVLVVGKPPKREAPQPPPTPEKPKEPEKTEEKTGEKPEKGK